MSTDAKRFETVAIEQYQYQLEQHSEMSAQTIPIHLTLGKLYERVGDKAAAIQEFAKVAVFYAEHGQSLKAMAAAQLIIQIDPRHEGIVERLGELYFQRSTVSSDQMQEYQDAIKNIEALQDTAQEGSATGDDDELEEEGYDGAQLSPEMIEQVVHALKQIPLFARLSVSELRGVQANSKLRSIPAGKAVISQGNVQRSLFVILQGSVNVIGKNKEQQDIFLAKLDAGISFGEFALFGRIDTNLSVVADEDSRILEIPREIVLKLAKRRPQVTETLKALFRRRILDTALARVPLFSELAPEDRQKILAYFKPVAAKEGTVIIREGASGNSMFFIVAGKVGVYTSLTEAQGDGENTTKEEQLLLTTLQSGDFFGEQALVTNDPRSATVMAHTNVTLLQFTKKDLLKVMDEYPWIESALQIETLQHRMEQRITIFNHITTPEKATA